MTTRTAPPQTREEAERAAVQRYGERIRAAMVAYEAEKMAAMKERNDGLQAALLLQPARGRKAG